MNELISPHGADVAPTQAKKTARTLVERRYERTTSDEIAAGNGSDNTPHADGLVVAPLATAAALDPSVFSKVSASKAIPATWEEQACKDSKDRDIFKYLNNCFGIMFFMRTLR